VRGFFGVAGQAWEDPVTGSLNGSAHSGCSGGGVLEAPYVARQGTAMGRAGRVHIDRNGDTVWVGRATTTVVAGAVAL
jgi:predicted PhzF superfamily epimerase YddE/YHI9